MNILIIGSGGREHAFAWKISQSPQLTKLFVAPGNPGTASLATNLAISVDNFEELGKACLQNKIELILVGPEVPLVNGIKDYFSSIPELSSIIMVGPDKIGAQLEGSKAFSKDFMNKYGIPTASSRTFQQNEIKEAIDYLENHTLPIVLKADGLAAGKGVIIAETHEEAIISIKEMLVDLKFGDASAKVVVEQFLTGIELSVFVLSDGNSYKILPEAKDYKRIGEKDTGLNTGGMGAVSPVPIANKEFINLVEDEIIRPTMDGLKNEGIDYTGFVFFGLINVNGKPYTIEYNARMGDPETEVVMPRIKSDFVDYLKAVGTKSLHLLPEFEIDTRTATTIMLVSGGYPEDYLKNQVITGLENVSNDVLIFHAGTSTNSLNEFINTGGRVIACTGFGNTIPEALSKSNKAADTIKWNKKYYRTDIGLDLI